MELCDSIQFRRPELVLLNKTSTTSHQLDFTVPADHKVKEKVKVKNSEKLTE